MEKLNIINPYHNLDLLRKQCWNLRIEPLHKGWCIKFKNQCLIGFSVRNMCFRGDIIGIRHTKTDKNGRHIAYGHYYCMEQLIQESNIPFASSEIQAMKAYLGI